MFKIFEHLLYVSMDIIYRSVVDATCIYILIIEN